MGRPPKTNLPNNLLNLLKLVGNNIRLFREQLKLSQTELAKKARISLTTLNEIERRKFRDVRLSTLLDIATALNTDVTSFLTAADIKILKGDKVKLLKASEDILRIAKKIQDENK